MTVIRAALLVALCASTSCARSPASAGQPAASNLDGLWGVRRTQLESKPIDVVVRSDKGQWSVTVSDRQTPLVPSGDSLIASLTPAGTELRLRGADPTASPIAGHWVQPTDPSLGQPYATPIRLVRQADGTWTGRVVPLGAEVELYIRIRDGGAFIREPGRNFGRRVRTMTVGVQGSDVRFVDGRGREALAGTFDKESDTLAVRIERFGQPLVLTRRDRDNAPGYYPRASAASRYRYAAPPDARDGWVVATLAEVGMKPAPIEALVQSILDTETSGWTTPYIHSLVVARRGKLVVDEYFYGHDRAEAHDTRSAGKSFASTLVGIAVRDGKLRLKDSVFSKSRDPRRAAMQLEHLLSMTSGFDCDDNDESSRGNEDVMQNQDKQPDWYAYTRALDVVRAPGTKGIYCSAGINLTGDLLARATGSWIVDDFATKLAEPLDMGVYHFNLMQTGRAYLGGGIRLRTRDFAKLGQLYLAGGEWNGRRILTKDWVRDATAPHSSINEPDDYGLGWWRTSLATGDRRYDAFYASGNGGQLVIVVPELELVVAFNAGNYGNYPTWSRFRDDLVPRYVIAACVP